VTVLLSGGPDSAACASLLLDRKHSVQALFLDYGQAGRVHEARSALLVSRHLQIALATATLSAGGAFGQGEIQGRNAFLVFSALMLSDRLPRLIALGIHADSPYYDCTPRFLGQIDQLVAECSSGKIRVVAPLSTWTKAEILTYCSTSGIPLAETYSCENGAVPPCGTCLSCRDRHEHPPR